MFDRIILPNGLRVIGERVDHVRSCSIGCFVGVGSRNETPEENGMSHFIEHMVFKGTEHRSARQISDEMDRVGGQINAFTSKECTCFYAKVTDDCLPLAVDIISDLVLHPLFDENDLNKERGVVLEEIAMNQDTPDDLIMDLLDGVQFKGSLKMPILGPEEGISRYTREDMVSYWQRHYRPENMAVAISGHYDWDAFLELLNRFMTEFPNQKSLTSPSCQQLYVPEICCLNKDIEQLHIAISYPGVPIFSSDFYTVNMLAGLLGGGMSSRLFQRIREEMGKVYCISAYPISFKDVGSLCIYAATNPESGREVIEEIHHQVQLLLKEGITEDEFIRAKAQLRVGYLFGLENSSGRMMSIGRALLMKDDVKQPEEVIAGIDAVTSADAMGLAKRLMEGFNSGAVLGRNAEAVMPLLQGKKR